MKSKNSILPTRNLLRSVSCFKILARKATNMSVCGIHIYINFENASELRFSLMIAFFR